ncbi:MAG: polyprenyl synthetase family protein [Thermodesulfobacteriota bacterium]
MVDLKAYLDVRRERINAALDAVWVENSPSTRLVSAMRYSLTAGGKRLRPILCLAAAEAVGGDSADALPAACALELIHTYSLIHDDLPAMDDDDLRRGKPTCHKAFDEATAVLAGDGLLTLAFQILSESSSREAFRAEAWLRVIGEIARAAGYRGMIEGQMRDMDGETHGLGLKELEAMHRLKTGGLIQAAVRAGAILGGGTEDLVDRLDRYGGSIGLAFQVTDDILNVEGDPAVMGKAAGTDTTRNKNTYPALLGLEESKAFAEHLIQEALEALAGFDQKSDPLRAIARYILVRRR